MRILGIDPGYAIMGYGIVDYKGSKFTPVAYGSITTEAHTPNEERLMVLYDERTSLTELRRRCEALRASGKRVSTQCRPDDGLQASEILDLQEGGDSHA